MTRFELVCSNFWPSLKAIKFWFFNFLFQFVWLRRLACDMLLVASVDGKTNDLPFKNSSENILGGKYLIRIIYFCVVTKLWIYQHSVEIEVFFCCSDASSESKTKNLWNFHDGTLQLLKLILMMVIKLMMVTILS